VRSTVENQAIENRVPVTTPKTAKVARSFLCILSEDLSRTAMAGPRISRLKTAVKTAISITLAPSSMARTVRVPDVAHMRAASPVRRYAEFFVIFMVP